MATTEARPCRCSTHAPAGPPPPGLYDHPLSEASHQTLSQLPAELHQLSALDPAEAPQRLARYLRQLSEIAWPPCRRPKSSSGSWRW